MMIPHGQLATASLLAAAVFSGLSSAEAPSPTLEKRATTICGQWDSVQTGSYTLYQDLWGESAATSGSQCSTFNSLNGNTISWSTSWTWVGGPYSVKSYANVVVKQSTGYQISSLSSIPSTWDWSYTGSNIDGDVSYDIFTSSSATGSNQYEIMIWLAALGGAGPISSSGSPVATPTIAGHSWKLYSGPNGATTVYSFVATSEVTSFSGDIKQFLTYLAANENFSTSQYIVSIGAGTEPFTGSNAVLSVSAYSISFNFGGSTTTTTTKATTTTTATATKKTSSTTTTTTTSKAASSGSSGGSSLWGQCGGIGWTGPTSCSSGVCTYSNAYYSQCLPS
jgi:xyloglucan-specific endo-beta-1,4-glucanase